MGRLEEDKAINKQLMTFKKQILEMDALIRKYLIDRQRERYAHFPDHDKFIQALRSYRPKGVLSSHNSALYDNILESLYFYEQTWKKYFEDAALGKLPGIREEPKEEKPKALSTNAPPKTEFDKQIEKMYEHQLKTASSSNIQTETRSELMERIRNEYTENRNKLQEGQVCKAIFNPKTQKFHIKIADKPR